MDIYDRVTRFLDPDERLVPVEIFEKTRPMYDKVVGFCYLVGSFGENGEVVDVDWVWSRNLETVVETHPYLDFTIPLALVRAMTPDDVYGGFYVTGEEYQKNPDSYVVLSTICVVKPKEEDRTEHIYLDEYQANWRDYELLSVLHHVVYEGQ